MRDNVAFDQREWKEKREESNSLKCFGQSLVAPASSLSTAP